jgi:hypothetical protein
MSNFISHKLDEYRIMYYYFHIIKYIYWYAIYYIGMRCIRVSIRSHNREEGCLLRNFFMAGNK